MGKTKRRDPYARELEKPQYRNRIKRDKRKERLEKLNEQDAEVSQDWTPYLLSGATQGSPGSKPEAHVGSNETQGPRTSSGEVPSRGSKGRSNDT